MPVEQLLAITGYLVAEALVNDISVRAILDSAFATGRVPDEQRQKIKADLNAALDRLEAALPK